MAIQFSCGSCGKSYNVSEEKAGKKGRCSQCGSVMQIPGSGAHMPAPSAMPDPFELEAPVSNPFPTNQSVPSPATQGATIQCPTCGQQYRPAPEMMGTTIKCKCGSQVTLNDPMAGTFPAPVATYAVDPLTGQPPGMPVHPAAFNQPAKAEKRTPTKRERENELLAHYNEKDQWRRSEKKSDGAFAFEQNAFDHGVAGGLLLIVIAVVWFSLGLAAGVIFIWPPIMFVIGIAAIIHGLVT